MIFDLVSRHLKFLIGRVKCRYCFSKYTVEGCFIEIDAPNYVFSLEDKPNPAPAIRLKKYGMKKLVLIKGMDAKSTVLVHMVCLECGSSRKLRIDLDNAAFKYGKG